MPDPIKVNVVSYGGVKPGQIVAGNMASGVKTTLFDASSASNGNYGGYMFYNRNVITSWDAALPNLTDGTDMFFACSRLTSWNAALPELSNGNSMFQGTGVTSWNVALPKLSTARYMFYTDHSLASWDAALPNLTDGTNMFFACSRLTSWNGALPSLTNGAGMFRGCSLDGPSAKRVLTTIPDRASAGMAVADLDLGKRGNFKDDPGVQELLLGERREITAGAYNFKGWKVTVMD